MNLDPYSPASVVHNYWTGSVAGDGVDMEDVEQFLGIDKEVWRVLHIEISIDGGQHTIEPYAIDVEINDADLVEAVEAGNPIKLTRLPAIEYFPHEHSDTNPPAPLSIPIISATEFLGYGFKRLHLKMTSTDVPKGATFEFDDLPDQD
jgi:hypothetical protein